MRGAEKGAVYVEFLAVIGPLLLLFLGLSQLGLLYGVHLGVCHAAARAARAAIVLLPDEEDDYGGVPPYQVASSGEGLEGYRSAPEGGRLDQIRTAARITLAPFSPTLGSIGAASLANAIGEHPEASALAGLLGWTAFAVAVTFPDGQGGYLTSFSSAGTVTARVTFLFVCAVPLAREIMCHTYGSIDARARAELEAFGAQSGLLSAVGLTGTRFAAVSAERRLPIQGR